MRTKCLLFSLMLLTSLLINFGYAIDTKTLVGLWLLDEGKGEIVTDSSDNKLDGKLIGDTKWVDGKLGKALQFDGQDDCVEIPNKVLPEQYTFCMWIYNESADRAPGDDGADDGYGQTIFSSSSPGEKYGIWVTIHQGKNVRFYAYSDTHIAADGSFLTTSDPITIKKWHHIAVTAIKGGESHIYVDGKDVATFTNRGNDVKSSAYFIGDLRTDRKITFNGIIDDVAMFNVVLSKTEIENIMAQGLNVLAIEPSGKLTATWASIKMQYE